MKGKQKLPFLDKLLKLQILLDELKQRVKEKPSKKSGDPSEGKGEDLNKIICSLN